MITWEKDGASPPIEEAQRVIQEKDPITWRRLDSQYRFTWAIVPVDSPVASYLARLSVTGWQRIAADAQFALFIKSP